MKNYYEILEVDKKASFEVIDKAYRVLAKKYHPDRNTEDKKSWAEEQFKKINEAYETLSDISKRKAYDQELSATTIDYSKKYEELCKQQELLKQELQALRNRKTTANNPYISPQNQTVQQNFDYDTSEHIYYKKNRNQQPDMDEIRREEFNRAYQHILRNLGYTIRQKKTFKDFLAFLLTICILLFLLFVLWNIPLTKNYLISFYENNSIIKGIVDFFIL